MSLENSTQSCVPCKPSSDDTASLTLPVETSQLAQAGLYLQEAPHRDHEPSTFLTLPAELRNKIYSLLLDSEPAPYLQPGQTQLISPSHLARVNRQVRREFTYLLPNTFKIIARANDLNFQHITDYVSRQL